VGKQGKVEKVGIYIYFCILTFPPESLEGEDFLAKILKTQYIFPLSHCFYFLKEIYI
jgi:hypothetical protein